MKARLGNFLVLWMLRLCDTGPINVIDSKGVTRIKRFMPFWYDEWTDDSGRHHNRPPWYRPFNVLLHRWAGSHREVMHDHPRWSITILLRGKLVEHTPWGENILTPGSIVIRSRKYIHGIEVPDGYQGKTWTLFVVGRRNHLQNYYQIEGYDKEY